jgi:hypothetical protein
VVFTVFVLTGLAVPAHADPIILTATITSGQENPPTGTAANGFATFVLNDAQTAMTFTATIFGIDVNGLQTLGTTADNLVAAHIHAPAPPGVNAGVRWGFFGAPFNDNNPPDMTLTPFATGVGGVFTGKWDAPEGNGTTLAAQIPSILAGLAYINFHTTAFGGGEIRGQIIPTPEPGTLALLGLGTAAAVARRRTIRASR